jgi:hypothetical protein
MENESTVMTKPAHVRFEYGSGYVDRATGVRLVGYHPKLNPQEWHAYLDGAQKAYAKRGVEASLPLALLESGEGISLFFLGYDGKGEAVTGIRYHGPLSRVEEAALISEMSSAPDIQDIKSTVEQALDSGVVEIKGAWSSGEREVGAQLLPLIARAHMVALEWLDVGYGFATVAERMLAVRDYTGAIQIGQYAVAYPDERYRTVLVEYDRQISPTICDPEVAEALESDLLQLARAA